jgi:hypothetical protein
MRKTAREKREEMRRLALEAGFQDVRFGAGSSPKNRLYYTYPDGVRSSSDDLAGLKWNIEKLQERLAKKEA